MYLEVLKKKERFCLCFCNLSNREKGKTSPFRNYQLTSKLYLVYFRLNCNKLGATVSFNNKNAKKR